jgi:D-arabinose 1-dehydrogenase-like Zn-dependent alcohol dehydrogenase
MFPIEWPRVPGHEVVGKIDMLGSNVQGWKVGNAWVDFSQVRAGIANAAAAVTL